MKTAVVSRIRRFDIFAIFNMVSKKKEMGDKFAKGYGIWLARMVAGRKFGGSKSGHKSGVSTGSNKSTGVQTWMTLSGKPQTDKEYDKELENRFGTSNLHKIENFIEKAVFKGMSYEAIRDCKHYLNNGNRFQTGFCPECSKNFEKVFSTIVK